MYELKWSLLHLSLQEIKGHKQKKPNVMETFGGRIFVSNQVSKKTIFKKYHTSP